MTNHKQQPPQSEPIAIVGLGGLFPGSVDVAAFWNHILRGTDLITDIPKDTHWNVDDYFAADALDRPATAVDKTYAKRGAFLPKVPFDTLKEGIPPSLLASTDTAQLLAIMVGRAALTECFMGPVENADRSRVSCILGVTSGQELFGQMSSRLAWPQWIAGMRAAGIDEVAAKKAADEIAKTFTPWTEASFPGLLGNVVAGRVANRLDLGGSNAVTDAACASSFAAISMGIDELLLGRADVVLTGGVDTINDIFMYMCFTKTPALSASGECRPFDAASDGTLLGEGLGMLALKRLSDAERDGNTIYACITGVGTSSDGRSKSIYAPVSLGQSKALTRAYEVAGYSPATVELVEAHGTGTKAGDAAELGGLKLAFDDVRWRRSDRQFCAVGSVKSQIGHTKSAAGSAGIIKAALALHHKVLPPTIKVSTPNPQIDWIDSPFYVNPTLRPWFRGSDHPRRAGVSSFGFGGSNWHITLEEYTKTPSAKTLSRRDVEVLALSASSLQALQARAHELLTKLVDGLDVAAFCAVENVAFDAAAGARASFVVSTFEDLKKHLTAVSKNDNGPAVFITVGAPVDGKVAFIFPGQGSQTVEMGKALALAFAEARGVWDRAIDVLPDVVRATYPAVAFDDASRTAQQQHLTQTENAQPALGLASMATLRVLQRLNVPMDMTAGHSFGELSALCAAGVFDETALLHLARRRGELMKSASSQAGAMAAVVGDVSNLKSLLSSLGDRVVVANENAPDQAVISGEEAGIVEAIALVEKVGLRAKRLPVSTAFHSPLVAAASAPLFEALQATHMNAPSVPVFANTTAGMHGDVDSIRQQLAKQVQSPVRFVDEVNAMVAAGAKVFIEVGSGTVLTGLVSRIAPDVVSVAADPNKGLAGFFAAIARLCAAGVRVDLAALPAQAALPAVVPMSKTAVLLNGANVGKPPRPAPAAVTVPAFAAAPVMSSVTRVAPAPLAVAPVFAVAKTSAPAAPTVTTMDKPRSASPAVHAPVVSRSIEPTANAAWLSVFKDGQQQTLEAHLAFQKALGDAHASYLAAFESTSNALVSALHGGVVTTLNAPRVIAGSAPVAVAPVFVAPTTAPVVVVTPVFVAPKPAPVAAPVVVVVKPVAAPALTSTGRDLLFAVVAEKTGYPVSALDDSMHLESDLGIDSIKRVEILGALKEKLPAAAGMDALKLAQLATLGEIAAAVGGSASSTSVAAPAKSAATAVASSSSSGRDLLFAVVAEKTGYPVSALDDSMHLESDLGIDSIKRVEILGALKEKLPAAAGMDALKLAQLATLGEIAAAIGGSASTPVTISSVTTARVVEADVAPMMTGDARAILFAVVAEKTGYPVSALDDSMHLESDLGIDSIKRVEILGALKEQHSAAAGMDALKLAQLATLGEIAAAIGGGPSSSVSMPVMAMSTSSGSAVPSANVDGRAILFAVVAEKTGYPVSALDDSMHLESDLGIDSIKRVEILGALKEQHPAAAGMDALKLAQLATLGEIAAAIGGSSTSKASSLAETAFAPSTGADVVGETCPRAVVRLVNATAGVSALPAGPVAVVSAGALGAEVAEATVAALLRRGVQAIACTAATLPASVGSMLDLSAVDASDENAVAVLKNGLFTLQRVGPALRAAGGRAVVVTPGGGRFASTIAGRAPAVLGLSGLVKTARQEWPEVDVRLVDVDADSDVDVLADGLAAQMLLKSTSAEVGLVGSQVVTLVDVDAPISTAASRLVAGDVVVVTGGARGVTATCALALTKAVHGLKLAVLQRTVVEGAEPAFARHANDEGALKRAILADAAVRGSSVPLREVAKQAQAILAAREVRSTMVELQQGAEVELFACDVQRADSIGTALDNVRRRFGKVDVVVHGAGVLADKRIEDKTVDQVDRVVDTKVLGLIALLQHTSGDKLKALVVFSSVAGRFGNVGQVDYSMANEAMTRLLTVEKLRRPSLIAKALHWGPWEGGMVTPQLKAQFASRGITVIARDDGARAFVNELSTSASDDVEVVLGASIAVSHDEAPTGGDGGGRSKPALSAKSTSLVHISAQTMPFLADHAVKGDVVLPVVTAIDLMASAASAHHHAQVREVHDVEMIKGQRLPRFATTGHDAEVTLVTAHPTPSGMQVAAELRVDGVLAYRAFVELSNELEVTPPASRTLPPMSAPSFTLPLYAGSGGAGLLFHGPRFQLIEQLDGVDDMTMVARVQSTRGAGWAGRFSVDVAALDAGLQLLLLWARHHTGGAFLPTRVGAVQQHTLLLPRGPLTCVVEATQGLARDGVKATANIGFLDESGRIVFELRDVVAHRLPDDDAFGSLCDDVAVTAPAGAAE